jgi:acyl carrier protein
MAAGNERAWHVAVGADLAYLGEAPADKDSRRSGERMQRLLELAMVDAEVNKTFFDVMMMLAEPGALDTPELTARLAQGPSRPPAGGPWPVLLPSPLPASRVGRSPGDPGPSAAGARLPGDADPTSARFAASFAGVAGGIHEESRMTVPSTATPTKARGSDEVARDLARIWAELLDLDPDAINGDASFLRLGGDSVLAVRMSALIRKKLSVELALSDVTVEITLSALADLVARRSRDGATTRTLPVEIERHADPDAPFPLMPLQQGYFVGQHDGWELSYDSAHFYGDVGLRDMDADEAEETLADALHRLAQHQPTLRGRITPDGMQYVLPPDAPGAIPQPRVYDLREAGDKEIRTTLEAVRREMAATGPNPLTGPGLDVRLSLLPGGRGRLHTAMSLISMDGWSATVLNRELLALAADWNAVLAPLEVDFGDYVTSVGRLRQTDLWTADRDWWFDRLNDAPLPPALPLRADPRDVAPTLMDTRETRLDGTRWAALRERCAAHDVTPSAAMLTAFAVVLTRWAGHRRMLLNTLQLNRLPLHPDIHRTIGAFSSTMLVPAALDAGRTFAALAAAQQRTFAKHAAHNLISGVEVSRELARRRGTTRPRPTSMRRPARPGTSWSSGSRCCGRRSSTSRSLTGRRRSSPWAATRCLR